MHFPVPTSNGLLTLGAKSYILPGAGFLGGSPFALGSVFLTPQGALPTVTAAGTYDVPFNVGGSFCVTDDLHVPPPSPPDPACFSVLGTAVAHYTVIATTTPNAFFQPLPTIEFLRLCPSRELWVVECLCYCSCLRPNTARYRWSETRTSQASRKNFWLNLHDPVIHLPLDILNRDGRQAPSLDLPLKSLVAN